MYPRVSNTPKKQQPVSGDENVRKEAQLEESQKSVQPMGNEAANIELMNQMLREANADNELDLSGYEGLNQSRGNIDLNNSMYLNSSHNIVNEDWLDQVKSGKEKKEPGSVPKESEKKKDVKNPPQEDMKAALEIAEDLVQEQAPQQAPKEEEDFSPLSTYSPDEDLVAETGRKKKIKKGKKSSSNVNNLFAANGKNVGGIEDARWKAAAAKRVKKVQLENPAEQEAFQAEEMEKLKIWNFDAMKEFELFPRSPQPAHHREDQVFLPCKRRSAFQHLHPIRAALPSALPSIDQTIHFP